MTKTTQQRIERAEAVLGAILDKFDDMETDAEELFEFVSQNANEARQARLFLRRCIEFGDE